MKRIRDYGIIVGSGKVGKLNKITDVPGVTVGHYTIDNERHKTGVTVIMPTPDNIFQNKVLASTHVINGFGKSTGLVQINELGTIETPIALTSVLNVGKVHDALVSYSLEKCAKEGKKITSVNPVVLECNDELLNDGSERIIGQQEIYEAINNVKIDFEEGAIGAGKGVTCFGLKGGIGSSSRLTFIDGKFYTIGVLVQTNFGATRDLTINGSYVGDKISKHVLETEDKGSIIIVVATDLPVSERQLNRLIKRATVGLARTGSYLGHHSGDIVVGFTTANKITDKNIQNIQMINEEKLAYAFRMVAEATEEAILNSMAMADNTVGYTGNVNYSLTDMYLKEYEKKFEYEAFIKNVPAISQFPNYPVGCEVVALYELLKYYGVDVQMEDMAENLKKGKAPYEEENITYGANPEIEFVGDPRDYKSYGVYDKPIEEVANKFKPGIKNISGTSLNDVLKLVKKGYPVQAWVTIELAESWISKSWIHKETNTVVEWKRNLHSLVIVGYSKDYVLVADPNVGATRRFDRKAFEERYNFLGRRALYYEE